MKIQHDDKTIITGNQDMLTKLWHIPITEPDMGYILSARHLTQCTDMERIMHFYHAVLFSPTISTLTTAVIKGYFHIWTGLTAKSIQKYLKPTVSMAKGHLDQKRSNQKTINHNIDDVVVPTINSQPSHLVFATVQEIGKIYTDQTGKFPYPSSRGYKYIFILYSYDSNAILTKPIKTKTNDEILEAYKTLHTYLQQRGFPVQVHWLDNEASTKLKKYNIDNRIKYQLTPPNIHRINASERAVRTWKNHFIAGISSVNPELPMHLWDRLVVQATDTINMLRANRQNDKMSAYMALNGPYDFTKTPMAPPGTKVLVHEKSVQRGTWYPHGKEGWYLGNSLEHYRCYRT